MMMPAVRLHESAIDHDLMMSKVGLSLERQRDKQPGSGAGRTSKGSGGMVSGETNRCRSKETNADNRIINRTRRPDFRDADALLEPEAFVDTQMGGSLRVILQCQRRRLPGCSFAGAYGVRGCCAGFRGSLHRTARGSRRIVIDVEIGYSEVPAVELSREQKKITCQKDTSADHHFVSIAFFGHEYAR